MRATGTKEVRLFLQNIGKRTTAAMRAEMFKAAKDVEELAKKMVPEDTASLMDSIRTEEQPSSSHRYYVQVLAGDTTPYPYSKNGATVADYAAIVHENYEDYATDPDSEAGRRRRRKEIITGQVVGSKFLTRALDQIDQNMAQRLGRVLTLIGGYEQ